MKAEKKTKLYMTKEEYCRLQDAYSILQEIETYLDSPVFGDAMHTILDMINNENEYEISVLETEQVYTDKHTFLLLNDDEKELRDIEKFLAKEIGVPYVRCSYDSYCSHKARRNEEFRYRIREGTLNYDEYVINYELYKTEKDYKENKGGYDGEVYELIYSLDSHPASNILETITLEYCYHKDWEVKL